MPLSSSSFQSGLPDLFGGNIGVLTATLNGLSKRHDAINGNIANASTPGYKKQSVDFEGQLGQAIQKQTQEQKQTLQDAQDSGFNHSRTQHLSINAESFQGPSEKTPPGIAMERLQFETQQEQGGVEIETEMADLARNSQKYIAVSRLTFKAFDGLKNVIKSTSS